jgi:HK97 family phage portal protein
LTPSGGWAGLVDRGEDRALPALDTEPSYGYPTITRVSGLFGQPLNVSTANALSVADAYACVRVLADSISSLPLHVYRKTEQGRVPAGDTSRAVQLLRRPSPGSTGVDLISHVMTTLAVHGECFIGKYRSADGEIAQLVLISPTLLQVELRGQRIVYVLDTAKGRTEHGPEDILHIKGMSADGLRGVSPVTQCATALGLSSALQRSAKVFTEQGSRPSGILTLGGAFPANREQINSAITTMQVRHAGVENMHRIAVLSGDVKFEPIAFSQSDAEFLGQRELSAREVARIFRVPAWAIDAPTGDSLTYANVTEQNRALVTHSLRPWIVRIEQAISGDPDLCPGSTFVKFELDGLLRADAATRSEIYTRALNPETGWMRREEARQLEELEPE